MGGTRSGVCGEQGNRHCVRPALARDVVDDTVETVKQSVERPPPDGVGFCRRVNIFYLRTGRQAMMRPMICLATTQFSGASSAANPRPARPPGRLLMMPPSPPPPSPKSQPNHRHHLSAVRPCSSPPWLKRGIRYLHIPFRKIWDSLEGPFSIPVAALNTRACRYGNPGHAEQFNRQAPARYGDCPAPPDRCRCDLRVTYPESAPHVIQPNR